jgi:hypothetical protein
MSALTCTFALALICTVALGPALICRFAHGRALGDRGGFCAAGCADG